MDNKFWLIQRGKFQDPKEKVLISYKGLICTDYMGSSEFEWETLQDSYIIIMDNIDKYNLYGTGILHKNSFDDLLVFCPKDKMDDVINELHNFCNNPYTLQEYAQLAEQTQIWNANNKDRFAPIVKPDFWWEISHEWNFMCFFSGDTRETSFLDILQFSYDHWWIKLSSDEKEELLKNAYSKAQGF